jgi:hypothetical protein
MGDEPGKPDKPRWSYATGCLCGLWCGIVGVALGHYLGSQTQLQRQAQIREQAADILQAKGRTVESNEFPQPFAIVGAFWGGCFGWSLGWLLTAFLPRKHTRTRRDYLLIGFVGLGPLCALIVPTFGRHLLR